MSVSSRPGRKGVNHSARKSGKPALKFHRTKGQGASVFVVNANPPTCWTLTFLQSHVRRTSSDAMNRRRETSKIQTSGFPVPVHSLPVPLAPNATRRTNPPSSCSASPGGGSSATMVDWLVNDRSIDRLDCVRATAFLEREREREKATTVRGLLLALDNDRVRTLPPPANRSSRSVGGSVDIDCVCVLNKRGAEGKETPRTRPPRR
jgi:hypothetical protein